MQASVRQVLRRLDKVDPGMRDFFMTAAKTVCEGTDPAAALAAALASLSGISSVPQSRSLLTQVGVDGPAGRAMPLCTGAGKSAPLSSYCVHGVLCRPGTGHIRLRKCEPQVRHMGAACKPELCRRHSCHHSLGCSGYHHPAVEGTCLPTFVCMLLL